MNALEKAIMDRATAEATFLAAVGARFYNTTAPQNVTFPYCVFFTVSDVPEYTFNTEMENTRIQFSIFSSTPSVQEIGLIFEKLKACFDFCTLTITGYDPIEMRRDIANKMRDPEEKWQYVVDYRIRFQKQ